jgi:hypothetical protein
VGLPIVGSTGVLPLAWPRLTNPLAGAGDVPAAFRVLADPATAPRRVWLYETGTWHNAALVLVLLLLAAAIVVPLWHLVLAPAAP